MRKVFMILLLMLVSTNFSFGQTTVADEIVSALRRGDDVTLMFGAREVIDFDNGTLTDPKIVEVSPNSGGKFTVEVAHENYSLSLPSVSSDKVTKEGNVTYSFNYDQANGVRFLLFASTKQDNRPVIFVTKAGETKVYLVTAFTVVGNGKYVDLIQFPSTEGYNILSKILNYIWTKY